ncbi:MULTISPECIES: ComEA family DNA-binding protein [unclassified Pseudomonas]|uniref:ComEA family DNA-binding protein n=1 Tax=unclassified Pseudomonas TaxID=196821 RepID=UPI0035BEF832
MRFKFAKFISFLAGAMLAFSAAASSASPVSAEGAKPPMIASPATLSESTVININHVDEATLQDKLTGVGKAKAQAIIKYRELNGPFKTVDELLEVKGIGNALLERNRGALTVD